MARIEQLVTSPSSPLCPAAPLLAYFTYTHTATLQLQYVNPPRLVFSSLLQFAPETFRLNCVVVRETLPPPARVNINVRVN